MMISVVPTHISAVYVFFLLFQLRSHRHLFERHINTPLTTQYSSRRRQCCKRYIALCRCGELNTDHDVMANGSDLEANEPHISANGRESHNAESSVQPKMSVSLTICLLVIVFGVSLAPIANVACIHYLLPLHTTSLSQSRPSSWLTL